jgi:four helix bundle protein
MFQNNKDQLKYRAYRFSIDLIKFVTTLPNQRIYWIIVDQLVRAATSIGANIIEAQAGSSKKDFIKFFEIALKSANETKYWLCLLRDSTEADKEKVNLLLQEANELSKLLGASVLTLKNKRKV